MVCLCLPANNVLLSLGTSLNIGDLPCHVLLVCVNCQLNDGIVTLLKVVLVDYKNGLHTTKNHLHGFATAVP